MCWQWGVDRALVVRPACVSWHRNRGQQSFHAVNRDGIGRVGVSTCHLDVCPDVARKPVEADTGVSEQSYIQSSLSDSGHKNIALLTLLFQPALLLIDSGHFQYNSVMLGTFSGRVLSRVILTF